MSSTVLTLPERLFLAGQLATVAQDRLESRSLTQRMLVAVISELGERPPAAYAEQTAQPSDAPWELADTVGLERLIPALQEHRDHLAAKLDADSDPYYREHHRGEHWADTGMPSGPLILQDLDLALRLLRRYQHAAVAHQEAEAA